ncbi:hypothetical protein HPY25_18680, partial [Methylobacterium sp. IIF4SW-B5]|nr:hypothetical protein [Methylobacterium ajmalii]
LGRSSAGHAHEAAPAAANATATAPKTGTINTLASGASGPAVVPVPVTMPEVVGPGR